MRTIAAALVVSLAASAQDAPTVEKLAWLAGSWEGPLEGGTFEEHWTKPAGKTMVGMGRHVVKDRTTFIEFLKIVETKDGVVMSVTVGEQSEVAFPLVKLGDQEAVFENPKHDYPTKITYRKEKDGSLLARIEGPDGRNPTDFKLKPKK